MELGNSLRSLDVSMDGSPVKALEAALPIAGPAIGKVSAKRSLKDLVGIIRIKAVECRGSNADEDPKEEPKKRRWDEFADVEDICKGDGAKPGRAKDLNSFKETAASKASENQAVEVGSDDGPDVGGEGRPEGRPGCRPG